MLTLALKIMLFIVLLPLTVAALFVIVFVAAGIISTGIDDPGAND